MSSKALIPTSQAPSIAVLVDTSTSWGRRVIRGATNYARSHGPWHLLVDAHGGEDAIRLPRGWRGEGVIARISSSELQNELLKLNVPVVNVSRIELKVSAFPRVMNDHITATRMAAEHFLERGYRNFAYAGPLDFGVVRQAADAFKAVLTTEGARCYEFDYKLMSRSQAAWKNLQARLGAWLVELPKPVGVYTWATETGARVLDCCRHHSIATPMEVAVLADDDDPLLCNTTTPPMSAVLHGTDQVGYLAASLIDRMLRGEKVSNEPVLIDPIEVTCRGSTESYAVEDSEMVRAITFIRLNCDRAMSVSDVAEAVPMGRRSLERKFRATFGRTPLDEIRRLRIRRVRELLATTEMSVADIAAKSGFTSPEHMTNTFRRIVGLSPTRYRQKAKGR